MSFVLNSQDLVINFLHQSPCTSYNFRSENFSLAPCNVFFDLNAVEIIWSWLYITQYLAWVSAPNNPYLMKENFLEMFLLFVSVMVL